MEINTYTSVIILTVNRLTSPNKNRVPVQWEVCSPQLENSPHAAAKAQHLEGWDEEGSRRDVQVGGDMGKPMADSYWCVVETNALF